MHPATRLARFSGQVAMAKSEDIGPAAGGSDEGEPTDQPLGAAESLLLIEAQRTETSRRLGGSPWVYFTPWGIAWFTGFGTFFLRFGPDGRVFVDMPASLPLIVLLTGSAAALITTGVAVRRVVRSIRGPIALQMVLFAWSGFAAFGGVAALGVHFGDRLPEYESHLLWGSLTVFAAAALLMTGAAIWRDVVQFGLGLLLMSVNVMGVIAGAGWHSLLVAVVGGGALIGVALLYRRAAPRRS
jgi:hypothetical protein